MGYYGAIFTIIAGRLRGYCPSTWRQVVWYTSPIKHQIAQHFLINLSPRGIPTLVPYPLANFGMVGAIIGAIVGAKIGAIYSANPSGYDPAGRSVLGNPNHRATQL